MADAIFIPNDNFCGLKLLVMQQKLWQIRIKEISCIILMLQKSWLNSVSETLQLLIQKLTNI